MAYNYVKMLETTLDHIDGTPDMTALFFKNAEIAKWYKMNKARLAKAANNSTFKTPYSAYEYLKEHKNGNSEAEAIVAKSPTYSYYYSRNVLKKRWPPGEMAIAKNVNLVYRYALDVIKGRFPEGEAIIIRSRDIWYKYAYATHVIKGRWLEIEPLIFKDAYHSRAYLSFLKSKRIGTKKLKAQYTKNAKIK